MENIFLRACRREPVPHTPVWLMRQAGRYQKSYRAIRDKTEFLDLCKNPALTAEITVSAQESLGADAAILFSDILLIVEPMGFSLAYTKGDGPAIEKAVRTASDVERIRPVRPESSLAFVGETIRSAKKRLKPGIALIGFAGAPFTLASYLIEGGATKDFMATRRFFRENPGAWRALLDKISDATADYLNYQIDCGVDAVQLFDSWAGALSPDEYRSMAMPYSKKVFDALAAGLPAGRQVPTLHFGTKTGPFLEAFAEAGGDVIGVDHRTGLDEAWKRIGPDRAVQGNLDSDILRGGDRKTIEREVRRILAEAGGRPGHIFNLGHGVLPETPEANAKMLVEMVHEFSKK